MTMRVKSRSFLFTVLSLLLIGLFLVTALELGTQLFLRRVAGFPPYPLFFAQGEQKRASTLAVSYSTIDSLLGWTNTERFTQYYSDPVAEADRLDGTIVAPLPKRHPHKIVGLGGSTTDPSGEPKNWVYQLSAQCSKASLSCHALNGGISGYTSTLELLKLERDVIPLRPDIVVSLNGVNDEGIWHFENVSFTTPYHRELSRFLAGALRDVRSPLYSPPALTGLLPNARFFFRLLRFNLSGKDGAAPARVDLGTADGFTRAERWEYNVRMMHAVSAEFGARYFVVLQPHLGLAPQELARKLEQMGASIMFDEARMREFYEDARARCAKLSYCLDLSRDFPLQARLFLDPMHLVTEGHALEGKRIFEFLRKKNAL